MPEWARSSFEYTLRMAFQNLEFTVRKHVAHIVLDRPEAANGITADLARELMQVAIACDEEPKVRAILLRGNGRMFCGGGDLKAFAAIGSDLPSYLKVTTTYLHGAISRFARQSAPLVCAVHGFAAGGGFSLAVAADLPIAAESAKFTMAYTKAGLTPDGSSTYYLARMVGMRRAMDLALTNRVLTAAEAVEWGLAARVVPDDRLVEEAEELSEMLAAGPTWAIGKVKELIRSGMNESLETQMELETRAIADAVRTNDAKEGIAAFIEKRRPKFEGC